MANNTKYDLKIEISQFKNIDIRQIIPVHIKAFKGYMNAGLGKRYVKEFLSWFLTYSKTITLKASVGNIVCGYVVGAPIGYDESMNKKIFRFAITGTMMHPGVLFHRNFLKVVFRKLMSMLGAPVTSKIINPEGKGISLVGLGVDSDYFGLGIGQKLLRVFEDKAIELNMDFMRLSVYEFNSQAIYVYEKCGWQMLGRQGNVFYYFKALVKN